MYYISLLTETWTNNKRERMGGREEEREERENYLFFYLSPWSDERDRRSDMSLSRLSLPTSLLCVWFTVLLVRMVCVLLCVEGSLTLTLSTLHTG